MLGRGPPKKDSSVRLRLGDDSGVGRAMIPSKYQGPTYPLNVDEFRHALHVGLGRTVIQANTYGLGPFAADVLDAALDCKVYDPQCEGYPAAWLERLCEAAGVVPQFLTASATDDSRSIELRCAILKELALPGYAGAREVLYSYEALGILSEAATANRWIKRYLDAVSSSAAPSSRTRQRRRGVVEALASVLGRLSSPFRTQGHRPDPGESRPASHRPKEAVS
jgi:hypothetical protein